MLLLPLNLWNFDSPLGPVSDSIVQQEDDPQHHHKKHYLQLIAQTLSLLHVLLNTVMSRHQFIHLLYLRKRQTWNLLSEGLRRLKFVQALFGGDDRSQNRSIEFVIFLINSNWRTKTKGSGFLFSFFADAQLWRSGHSVPSPLGSILIGWGGSFWFAFVFLFCIHSLNLQRGCFLNAFFIAKRYDNFILNDLVPPFKGLFKNRFVFLFEFVEHPSNPQRNVLRRTVLDPSDLKLEDVRSRGNVILGPEFKWFHCSKLDGFLAPGQFVLLCLK